MTDPVPLKISNQIVVDIPDVTKKDGSDHCYSFQPPPKSRPVNDFPTWDGQGVSQHNPAGGEKNVEFGTFTIEFAGGDMHAAADKWLDDCVNTGHAAFKDVTVEVHSADGLSRTYNLVQCDCQSLQPSAFRAGDTTVDTYTLTIHPTSMTIV